MISIRISNEEYREIKARCGDYGDLNVSEFVRVAMMCALAEPNRGSPVPLLELKVASLCSRIEKLERQLADVAIQVSTVGVSSELCGEL